MNYKVGDRVLVIEDTQGLHEGFEWSIVTIAEARESVGLYRIEEDPNGRWWSDDDFEYLVTEDEYDQWGLCDEPSKAEDHAAICTLLNEIYIQKNHDYGDSFAKQFKRHGLIVPAIRIEEKCERLINLIDGGAMVAEEKFEDTLLDLANYAIMTLVEMGRADEGETDNG